jgi:transposase
MGQVVTIGLDIAKSVLQLHGVDAASATVVRQQLARSKLLSIFGRPPRCLVGIEACAIRAAGRGR